MLPAAPPILLGAAGPRMLDLAVLSADIVGVPGRPAPRLQFSVFHLDVTDVPSRTPHRSTWADAVEDQMDSLEGSPAAIVGTAAECADKIREYSDRFGIDYWHLGQDTEAASTVIAHLP